MNILLCGEFDAGELDAWRAALRQVLPDVNWLDRERALQVAPTVQAAVVANPVPGSLLGLPGLRLIQSLWAGVDRLLADPTLPAGVPIARMVDPAMATAMAETALWATLGLHRGFFANAIAQRGARWLQQAQQPAADWHVGVLGVGRMGLAVAQRLQRCGYRVSGWRAGTSPADFGGLPVHGGNAALWQLLPTTQIVVNLLPLTEVTRGLLDSRFFAALPRGAALINLARGAHVVDADLLAALHSGHLQHAVLDVFNAEPLPAQHPFWSHPQISVLPHVAAQTDPRSAAQVVASNINALAEGRPIAHLIEPARGY
jgi:glyoxylate/hydroxypyruvate reductase A